MLHLRNFIPSPKMGFALVAMQRPFDTRSHRIDESRNDQSTIRKTTGIRGNSAMNISEFSNSTDEAQSVDFLALLGRCLGNFKILERVLVKFHETGWADLNQLQSAIEESNFQLVVDVAHRFKGAASNVSAVVLTKILSEIEQLGIEEKRAELTPALEELRTEWHTFLQFVKAMAPSVGEMEPSSVNSKSEISEARHACAGC